GPDNYILAKSFPVEGGVNRFIVRSATTPGIITVHAKADGLKPASIQLSSQAVVTEGGLSKDLPALNLPSNLTRGATPATPSYTISRRAVDVKAATAGANTDQAQHSYDDNELSDWVNDGKLSTAWIEYELERDAVIEEIA